MDVSFSAVNEINTMPHRKERKELSDPDHVLKFFSYRKRVKFCSTKNSKNINFSQCCGMDILGNELHLVPLFMMLQLLTIFTLFQFVLIKNPKCDLYKSSPVLTKQKIQQTTL